MLLVAKKGYKTDNSNIFEFCATVMVYNLFQLFL